ncbi:MAG: hypothetical protein NTZ97_04585 [Candidatus Moranbacteria bacterium]|nr:hypothetical protein [Candidatus Moranbacteria bacterium]
MLLPQWLINELQKDFPEHFRDLAPTEPAYEDEILEILKKIRDYTIDYNGIINMNVPANKNLREKILERAHMAKVAEHLFKIFDEFIQPVMEKGKYYDVIPELIQGGLIFRRILCQGRYLKPNEYVVKGIPFGYRQPQNFILEVTKKMTFVLSDPQEFLAIGNHLLLAVSNTTG